MLQAWGRGKRLLGSGIGLVLPLLFGAGPGSGDETNPRVAWYPASIYSPDPDPNPKNG